MIDGLLPELPGWAWGLSIVLVLLAFSWGVRQRDRLDPSNPKRSVQALERPAKQDVRRAGGFATGVLLLGATLASEVFHWGGSTLTELLGEAPEFFAWGGTAVLGYLGLSGRLDLGITEFGIGVVLIGLVALVVMEA